MVDSLNKAIGAMSLEEEEPLNLGDDPSFRVLDENEKSLMGRLVNPDCQSMARMIDYMPTAWRVVGRVRGIALSRDRFQFIFQREEDLQTVLKDRPWSYNHWALLLERWTAHPAEDYLQSMMLWVRIRHIPVNFFITKTMFKLASEVGLVEEIAYDPEISHTKEYVRALVTFKVENPLKASRKLTIPGEIVTIEYEYEKIYKRCFHCLRMTHEKIRFPLLRRGSNRGNQLEPKHVGTTSNPLSPATTSLAKLDKWDGPPGFPPLFPELSKQDQKMAMLYISHADETERLARIERVRQGIAESQEESSARITRITRDLDKGKGHVFSFQEAVEKRPRVGPLQIGNSPRGNEASENEAESGSSSIQATAFSAPTKVPTGFHLGLSSEGRVTGNLNSSKSQRRRPPSWKRKTSTKPGAGSSALVSLPSPSTPATMKRKSNAPLSATDNKTLKTSDSTVASVLKPLLPQ
ncbi:hypothetical protein BRARA_J00700 [Brassica rapa]|uniref:DUF4283 domain-containing protein n=1 Tax=Brassica campestris TaxID=3711 RepID=A0A397XIT3_BRACM|nr:hypothetical protein BRARA_J00700 [Brassica rapa]